MPATSGCFTSLSKLATLTVVVIMSALCRLAGAANPTCNAGFNWAFNSLNQSPCDVTAALGGVCTGGDFSLASLTPTQIYAGPSAGFGTPCRCNTVYYSTLSACALCQGANFTIWTFYKANCTTEYTETFPSPIPSGFSVPHWAYLDVTAANGFDPVLAQAAATSGPDSSAIPQATGSTTPSTTTYPSSSKQKTNVGAIAGGVVGGVVGLALIGGVIFWLLRRRQTASSQPTPGIYDLQPFTSYEKPNAGNTGTTFVSTSTPKFYDPNDPTTFPAHAAQNHIGTNTLFTPQQLFYPNLPNFAGSPQMPLGPGGHNQYTGAPEF